jgi:hypothetical protein
MPADFLKEQGPGARHGQKERPKQRDALGRFPRGRSGNPAGRPPGVRNAATEMAEALLDGEAEALTRKCIELALEGDRAALKLCIERLVPRRARAARFDLPEIAGPGDIGPAIGAIARAAASGAIPADDGAELARIVEGCVRTLDIAEFDRRLSELEKLR